MNERGLEPGDIVTVILPYQSPSGHEQQGERPAVVVGLPDLIGKPRYPMLVVVPLTSKAGEWANKSPKLYPTIAAGAANLPRNSIALLDHIRAIDVSRLGNFIGTLTPKQFRPIRDGLLRMCGS